MRARCNRVFTDGAGNVLAGATVYVYQPGTTTAITETIYQEQTGSDTLSNPLTADSNGTVRFYLAAAKRVDLKAVKTGYTDTTLKDVQVAMDPEDVALLTTHNVAAAVHGLPASVNVLGDRTASGRYIQHAAIAQQTLGSSDLPVYGLAAGAITFPVAFNAAPQVFITGNSENNVAWGCAYNVTTTGYSLGLFSTGSGVTATVGYIALGS